VSAFSNRTTNLLHGLAGMQLAVPHQPPSIHGDAAVGMLLPRRALTARGNRARDQPEWLQSRVPRRGLEDRGSFGGGSIAESLSRLNK